MGKKKESQKEASSVQQVQKTAKAAPINALHFGVLFN
jgi:hypothetical protein